MPRRPKTPRVVAAARRNILKAQITRVRWREPGRWRRVNRVLRRYTGIVTRRRR